MLFSEQNGGTISWRVGLEGMVVQRDKRKCRKLWSTAVGGVHIDVGRGEVKICFSASSSVNLNTEGLKRAHFTDYLHTHAVCNAPVCSTTYTGFD